ncbi:hypothetical protein HNY73_013222 [Argiope bruennichi]|uniref:Uncharacterized protein n=1 Tax=Argiope bruennichi TaxID=94029 RepID=A0A8T0EZ16_ARGBR|nr:hypothetical protein HNY73_013222 [Argiope bruennichi]
MDENLSKGPTSLNAIKRMMRKFEETSSVDVALGRERRATETAIVAEVATTTDEVSASSSNVTASGRSTARSLDIPWADMRML